MNNKKYRLSIGMQKKRVLILFALLVATSTAVFWLSNVLADATVSVNTGLTVSEGGSSTITETLLFSEDPLAPGAILTYTLVTTPTNGSLLLNGTTTLTPTGQFYQSDINSSLLSYVHDGSETLSDNFNFTVAASDTITNGTFLITITPVFNQIPTVNDQSFSIDENSLATTAVGTILATDLDAADALTYTILNGNTGTAFEIGSINSTNAAITVANTAPLDYETNQSITFTVQVEDKGMLTDTAVITVNVLNQNEPPILNNNIFTVTENSANTTLVGTLAASDPDAGDTLTYTITASDPVAAFGIGSGNGQITVTDTTQLDFETTPTFTLTVEVEDSGLLTDTAQIIIDLTNANEPPVLTPAGPFSIPENSVNTTPVGTLTSNDPDAGETLTYSITASDPVAAFGIGSSNGQITVTDTTQLDFETTPTFTLTVEVEDSGLLTDTAQVVINLTNANDPPVLSPAGPFSIPENNATTVGTPMSATDDDLSAGDVLTYTITAGDSGGAFSIGSSTGQIAVANDSLLDYDTPPTSYNLTIQVEDSAGATDTEIVTVNLTDINEPPSTSNATYTPNENLGNGQFVGDVLATDPEGVTLNYNITAGDPNAAFAVNTAGEIIVNDTNELDYETTPAYTLTVAVDDGVNTAVNTTVFINLTNVNEPPMVNNATFAINENSSNGTAVGTVTFSDPDAGDAGNLTFDILSGNTNGAFAIGNNGQITVANTNQLDFETTQSFTLGIIVTDTGSPPLDNTATITININNLFDESPTVSNATYFVDQGAANGVLVGTISATDPETVSGDQLTFSIIGGNTGTVFAINSSTGQLTVPDTSKLDADAMPVFNLTVRVIDLGGQVDTATITVNVSPLPITYIYLPTVLNNYPPIEPNNNCTQAYNLGTGINYEFTADDQEDWYAITLTSQRNVSIVLSSFEPAEGQLIIYGGSCSSGGLTLLQSNGSTSSTKTLTLNNLGAGTYYIRVFSKPITNTTYNLQVNFN
jgi:hypothetical protein